MRQEALISTKYVSPSGLEAADAKGFQLGLEPLCNYTYRQDQGTLRAEML